MVKFWILHRLQASFFSLAALWGFSSLLGFTPRPADWLIVPLLTTYAYQLNRLSDLGEDAVNDPEDARTADEHRRSILVIVVVCAVAALVLGIAIANTAGLAIIGVLLVLGFVYSVPVIGPVIGSAPKRRLKDLFVAKNLAPALGLALTVCLYPAANAGFPINLELIACLAALFAGGMLVELICDVRDREGDRKAGVRSLPVVLGLGPTRTIINVINTVSALCLIIGVATGLLPLPWTLFIANCALVALVANPLFDQLAENRKITHALIFFQIVMAVLLRLIARRGAATRTGRRDGIASVPTGTATASGLA
jgi:4-hydroxybenzoate polyprenyltransferase